MTAKANMICPSCQTFQPRAVTCEKCGIVVNKLAKTETPDRKPTVSTISESRGINKTLILLIAVPVIGFFAFSGSDDAGQTANAKTSDVSDQNKVKQSNPTDRLAVIHPGAVAQIKNTAVRSKLHGLKTMLYQYTMEGAEPPTDEEGLQLLVDRRYLSKSEITDEWGNTFAYRLEWGKETPWGKEYKIFVHSNGPDGISGNYDDIGMP